MEIGSLVARKDGSPIRSGAEEYGGGICVSLSPFIVVSEKMDMVWKNLTIDEFEPYKDIIFAGEALSPYIRRAMGKVLLKTCENGDTVRGIGTHEEPFIISIPENFNQENGTLVVSFEIAEQH